MRARGQPTEVVTRITRLLLSLNRIPYCQLHQPTAATHGLARLPPAPTPEPPSGRFPPLPAAGRPGEPKKLAIDVWLVALVCCPAACLAPRTARALQGGGRSAQGKGPPAKQTSSHSGAWSELPGRREACMACRMSQRDTHTQPGAASCSLPPPLLLLPSRSAWPCDASSALAAGPQAAASGAPTGSPAARARSMREPSPTAPLVS